MILCEESKRERDRSQVEKKCFRNYRIFKKIIDRKNQNFRELGVGGVFFENFLKISVEYRPKKQNFRRLGGEDHPQLLPLATLLIVLPLNLTENFDQFEFAGKSNSPLTLEKSV